MTLFSFRLIFTVCLCFWLSECTFTRFMIAFTHSTIHSICNVGRTRHAFTRVYMFDVCCSIHFFSVLIFIFLNVVCFISSCVHISLFFILLEFCVHFVVVCSFLFVSLSFCLCYEKLFISKRRKLECVSMTANNLQSFVKSLQYFY